MTAVTACPCSVSAQAHSPGETRTAAARPTCPLLRRPGSGPTHSGAIGQDTAKPLPGSTAPKRRLCRTAMELRGCGPGRPGLQAAVSDDAASRGGVSSKSLTSKRNFRSGEAKMPKLDRCASPHAWTTSPELGVVARSLAIGSAAPRKYANRRPASGRIGSAPARPPSTVPAAPAGRPGRAGPRAGRTQHGSCGAPRHGQTCRGRHVRPMSAAPAPTPVARLPHTTAGQEPSPRPSSVPRIQGGAHLTARPAGPPDHGEARDRPSTSPRTGDQVSGAPPGVLKP
jgi:hypothetical protein